MKVKDITRCIIKEADLDIIGATLLTTEQAEQLPERLKRYDSQWWLKSPGGFSDSAVYVDQEGSVIVYGHNVDYVNCAIRPALTFSNLGSSNLQIGDRFKFGGKEFEIVSGYLAFCLEDIGKRSFRTARMALNANDYEKSDIKKYVNRWFEKSVKESNSEDKEKEINKENEIKRIEEIKEALDKLSKELVEISQTISPRKSHDDAPDAYTRIPPTCRDCPTHTSNGGTGRCTCGLRSYSYSTTIHDSVTNSRYYKPTTNTYDKTTLHKFEKSIEESNKESDLDISGATLLTAEEVERLPERLREYNNSKLWWMLQPQDYGADYVASVYSTGIVSRTGDLRFYYRVRPVLIISNLKSSGLKIGDTFKFGNKEFEIISDNKAFCLGDIGYSLFREDCKALDANDYEKSDIKNIIDEWFKKSIKESNNES